MDQAKKYANLLDSFRSSTEDILLLERLEVSDKPIYVLDSSFNPPHFAHLGMCLSIPKGSQLLLLLSITNADKPVAPAAFNERILMMEKLKTLIHNCTVSVAICKHALFVDKCRSISNKLGPREQVYLVGFDTLIRILDCKYYKEKAMQQVLQPFFSCSQILCFSREVDGTTTDDQAQYLEKIKKSLLPNIPSQWSEKIKLTKLKGNVGFGVSSTRARQAIISGDEETQRKIIPQEILNVIKVIQPYRHR
ncbi:putative nicotinamide mononucleotide adenylyltransferase [Schizosaccharomyces pombe]|uniref:Putative nicotinamide mononucleotide adenylyltransferase n=2 Tax=Schizosaccharomyces pombe TaxID=4896 RepID=POF1L_SCHPO|nr:uncharacterized protein SPAC694.03 [Schizosaccharomyces pombe]Q9P7T7.1 RecName: Full=Putative nicotinamide mononucleotide adenylyltransferase; Short=NMN adenylyltransferase; Short=NMNAT; AltName: Full=NMN-specific adenylyltransferase; AltName: Full=Protein POF1 homolog [Schizosaccharomyces pombe 972h-]BAN67193.1 conserved fungal protein [Schizosaccharomyces pombe]BAN67205.1 conserved fungal protein [Schizosaccharomyces pombe]CAB71841.1 conserved fungal protein [Schizosaccharomyces pombe]|eukprot:NP_594483.1 uncharacterized protein SPAC694.03 [Schizosaccharomyces pombe]